MSFFNQVHRVDVICKAVSKLSFNDVLFDVVDSHFIGGIIGYSSPCFIFGDSNTPAVALKNICELIRDFIEVLI